MSLREESHSMSGNPDASTQKSSEFLAGGGEMGQLIRDHDWASTPVGPPDTWSQSLRTTVRLMLNTNHPIFIFWGQRLTCFYNDAYRATLGPERHPQSLGADGHDVWAEIWHIISPEIDQVMTGRGATWNEQKLIPITRHGRVDDIYWTYSYSPIDDELAPGGIGGVLVICSDVTAQHNATEALRQERERLMQLFKQAPGFITVLSGPTHVFDIANDAYLQLIGRRDVVGLTVREALPRLQGQGFFELLDQVYNTGQAFIGDNVPVSIQTTPDSPAETRYLNFIYQPIRDQQGLVTGIFVEGYDNTASKLAEIKLRQEFERTQAIIENAQDIICAFDEHGHFVSINDKSLVVLGYEPDEMVGRHYAEFVLNDDVEESVAVFANVLRGNPVVDFENRYRHKNGHIVHVLWSAVWAPQQDRLFATGKDITERLKAEELLRHAQRLDAIGQLTGGMAHDFNNLLTVILGSAEQLASQLPKHTEHHLLAEMILKASTRGAALTHRLLAFARKQPLAPTVVEIKKTLLNLNTLLQRTLGENIQIDLIFDDQLDTAMVDESQLESAILNLCLNSRDAMPNGGKLTIWASNAYLSEEYAKKDFEVQAGHYVMIAVADTGTGILPEHLPRVFDPFFTTKDVEHGTGLGLSMVIGLVKQSRGHVTITSDVGQGTEVRLYLPRAVDETDSHAINTLTDSPRAGREVVLIVEDNDLVREFAAMHLRSLGYQTIDAENGVEALNIIRNRPDIDLLFTDIIMPGGKNGRELAQLAKQYQPGLKVLYTSGYSQEILSNDLGFRMKNELLKKPYTALELAKRVRGIMNS